ncbi:uncharacterized protein LOC111062314 [Nilaparvata lugens]|uniref:uncharacterized protein LOC111062314 n=1 Tax=Nilaparvata lugens TaxID=108931 RepID=UPI00193E8E87|nr:uncharacterized protein LOC111062314 [Nilaparvata lugens]
MAEPLPDAFGYDEAEFNEPDESLNPSVDQMSRSLPGGGGGAEEGAEGDTEQDRREALFEEFCAQKVHTLDDDDDNDDDDSEDGGGDARDEDGNAQWAWNGDSAANFNRADDIERPGPEGREEGGGGMELDQWVINNNRSAAPWSTSSVIPQQDPWANTPISTSTDDEGWANFDAQFDTAASDGFTSDNRSEPTGSVAFQSESTANSLLNSASVDSFSGIISASASVGLPSSSPSSDNNANISSVPQNEPAESAMLIDNFRFLSGTGLMSTANGEIAATEENKDDVKDKEMSVDSSREEQGGKNEVQPEIEKVVVLAAAAASTSDPANQKPGGEAPPTSATPPPSPPPLPAALNSA